MLCYFGKIDALLSVSIVISNQELSVYLLINQLFVPNMQCHSFSEIEYKIDLDDSFDQQKVWCFSLFVLKFGI